MGKTTARRDAKNILLSGVVDLWTYVSFNYSAAMERARGGYKGNRRGAHNHRNRNLKSEKPN